MKKAAGLLFALVLMAGMLLPGAVQIAQTTGGGQTGGTGSTGGGQQGSRTGVGVFAPLKFDSMTKLIQAVMEGVKNVGFLIGFVGIIYSGFLFVKAQGKPEALKVARAAFTWTIVGVFIILGAEILVDVIINTLFKDAA